jgi:hypothetical protein
MTSKRNKLPAKVTRSLYNFKKSGVSGFETTSTQGDGTTTCTTVLTTTHFNKQ